MQRCHQWPNGSKRCLLLTKSNATKGKLFLEMSSLNFEVSYDTVPGWTLKGSVTRFVPISESPNWSLVYTCSRSCFWGWKKQKPLNVLVGREMKDKSLKETKWRQKFKLANWSALGLEPQRTPVWRGWVKYHKPQMFSTNSLILEITILCRDKNLLPMNQRWDVECEARQPDKPHWNQLSEKTTLNLINHIEISNLINHIEINFLINHSKPDKPHWTW